MFRRACLVIALGSATAVAGPSGRVIRVERTTSAPSVAPKLCVLRADTGTCVGDQPMPGQTAYVLDARHAIAEVQIVEATSFAASCTQLWNVKTRSHHALSAESEALAVIDPNLNPSRARMLHGDHLTAGLNGAPDEEVWRAIDRDGDGVADILLTRYSCDAAGKAMPGVATFCMDVWARNGEKLARTTQLNFAQCNL